MTGNDITDRLDGLETRLDEQQRTIDSQRERLEEQAEIIDRQRDRLAEFDAEGGRTVPISRRQALQAGGVLGLLGLGAGHASADPQGQVGTNSDPLERLYTDALDGGETGDVTMGTALNMAGNAITNADGVEVETADELGVEVNTTGNADAIKAQTDGQDCHGVFGHNTVTHGWSWGVRGDTESTNENAYGVRGQANAISGSSKGVGGVTSGEEDGAAGVHGEAESDFGAVYGVHGETASTGNKAAGVLGESPGSGANGVMGLANVSDPADRADEAGVYGETGNSPGYGVFGYNTSESGIYAEGVFGLTDSPESPAVTGENTADGIGVKSDGNLEVVGHTDVSETGLSAYLSANQTIDNNTTTTVVFDSTNADHFNGYDTSTGQYTIQRDGDYHVSFTIDWQTNFSAGVNIDYELQINESTTGGIQADTTTATSAQRVCRNFSRTLFGLSQGDYLEVAVSQDSGSTADIYGSDQVSYLTIYKVG